MEIIEAIQTRCSVNKLLTNQPKRSDIRAMLDAAVRAPIHRMTEPWRFVVIAGESRDELGDVLTQILQSTDPDATKDELARERAKPLRAPVLIGVSCLKGRNEVETHENIAGTAAGIQNMLLAAHSLGLGAQWRTGDNSYTPLLVTWLGAPEDAQFMGFIYVGYRAPLVPDRQTPRRPSTDLTDWRGWQD